MPVTVVPPPAPAMHMCRYKFCRPSISEKSPTRVTDKSLTKSVCDLKGNKIGTVDQSRKAKLKVVSKLVDISKWTPYGPKQKFEPTFFKTFAIYKGKLVGVGHETMEQNQKKLLKKKKTAASYPCSE